MPMSEIAGMDSYQLAHVYCRKRDKRGRLVRRSGYGEYRPEVDEDGMRVVSDPVPFSRMFGQVCRGRGMGREQATGLWRDWLTDNPDFRRHAENG